MFFFHVSHFFDQKKFGFRLFVYSFEANEE